ncbi:MAG: hypothetical protein ACFFE4_09290 [Candidatus Thorarchaeota archaeon]
MSNSTLDLKLQTLIHACKATGNYKKLSVVSFILTSNTVDEISIKLGMRPRLKKEQEKIFEYISLVNEIFSKNLHITIFRSELINSLKEVELLFLKTRGNLPYEYIRQLIANYYELRKIEVPNLYKGMKGEDFIENFNMGILNFFSRRSKPRENRDNRFKPILLHTIYQKEKLLQSKLNERLNQSDLEMAIHLQKMKRSLEKKGTKKILLQGELKDNIIYEQSHHKLIGYLMLGIIVISLLFGFIMLVEVFYYPLTMQPLNHLILISFGLVFLFIVIYRNYSNRGGIK